MAFFWKSHVLRVLHLHLEKNSLRSLKLKVCLKKDDLKSIYKWTLNKINNSTTANRKKTGFFAFMMRVFSSKLKRLCLLLKFNRFTFSCFTNFYLNLCLSTLCLDNAHSDFSI